MTSSDKNNIPARLFDVSWIIFLAAQLAAMTGWYALNDSPAKVIAYKAAMGISCLLAAAVIIIGLIRKTYRIRPIVFLVIFGIITALSWYFSRDTLLLWMFLMIAAAYGQDGERIVRIAVITVSAMLVFTIALSLTGVTEDFIFVDGGRMRHSLGYNWATNAPTLLFFLGLAYIFIRKERMKFWEFIILEAANVFLFIMTDTNIPFLLMSLYLILFFVETLFKNHWRILRHLNSLYVFVPVIICALSVLICVLFNPDSESWQRLNSALNHRLGYVWEGIRRFGITPFGRQIAWIGNAVGGAEGAEGAYNYVDCSYMQILLNYGVVFLAAVTALYTALVRNALKVRDHWLISITAFVMIHSFTEPRLYNMAFNVIPVLAFAMLRESEVETLKSLSSTNLSLKFTLRSLAYRLKGLLGANKAVESAFAAAEERGAGSIPVFIISFDRLSYLEKLIASLERAGASNIHIIDNASTYPPLLEYYKKTPYDVIYVGENLGARVFWKSGLFDRYRNDFYAVTDSDLELIPECPDDLIETLFETLRKYPFVRKAGVSLKIDDLPDDTELGAGVREWESQFFKAPIKGANAYYASVDTTLAVYLPDNLAGGIPFLRAIRCATPYQARHLPWYKEKDDLTEEDIYYSTHRSNGWWDVANGEVTPD